MQQIREYVNDDRRIFVDKASGKDFKRPMYKLLVGTEETAPLLRNGDTLYITSLDRLGRNYDEIRKEWRKITQDLCVNIIVLDMPLLSVKREEKNNLDSRFVAELTLQILSYVAEKERLSIRSRQRQGIDVMPVIDGKRVSLKTGRPTGRPPIQYPTEWKEIYDKWTNGEITATAAMKQLKLKRSTFYRLVIKYRQNTK